jgi:HD-GYP domain-containing protein (c-di-GMP phosphodiesterase class II)
MPTPSFALAQRRRHALAIFAAGLAVALAVGVLGGARFAPIERLDNAFLDAFVDASKTAAPASKTVVIDIDDVSLSAVGQWPWPRYRVASMIQRIATEKPAAIALDIVFPESDRSSPNNIRETFKHDFGLDVSFNGVPDGLLDNDGFLGEQIAQADVVGSRYFYFDHSSRSASPLSSGATIGGHVELLSPMAATGVLSNADEIAVQTRTTGFINTLLDDDGVLRRQPLVISRDGALHPSLALAAVMRGTGVSHATVVADPDGLGLQVGKHRIPSERDGIATLRFERKPAAYSSISAVDILNGNFRPADIAGRIVFIGSSAVGLNDIHLTAVDPHFPGLKTHSVLAENILADRVIATPSWTPMATLIACLLVGTLMSAMFALVEGTWSFVSAGAFAGALLMATSALLYQRAGQFVSPAAPLLVALLLGTLFFVTRFLIDRKRAATARRQLENSRQVTIESMASVAETRDPETGAHIKRTQHYVRAIARELKKSGHFPELLTESYIDLLFLSAPLHDIGKVGVPDNILLKPGRLTPDEMEIMKQHAEFGRKIVHNTAERIDGDNFLVIAGEIAATHHEKWDGTGYPLGLAGHAIPLSGRIMAAADIYDALISRRCYKEPFTHEHSTTLMRDMRGTTFDPVVLDAFFRIETTILEIAQRFSDETEESEAEAVAPVAAPGQLTDIRTQARTIASAETRYKATPTLEPELRRGPVAGDLPGEKLTPEQVEERAAAGIVEMLVDC